MRLLALATQQEPSSASCGSDAGSNSSSLQQIGGASPRRAAAAAQPRRAAPRHPSSSRAAAAAAFRRAGLRVAGDDLTFSPSGGGVLFSPSAAAASSSPQAQRRSPLLPMRSGGLLVPARRDAAASSSPRARRRPPRPGEARCGGKVDLATDTPSMVRVVSSRTVKPPPRPRERVPLTSWDVAMLSTNYIQKGLLFHKPTVALNVVDHLAAALADALADYYPVAGRFATDQHCDESGAVVGCSVHIDCDGQGVEMVHAVADGVAVADVIPPDADVPGVVQYFFPLGDAVGHDGHELPLFVVQVTELADGVFVGFVCNHALADGAALWDFLNAWAEVARARLSNLAPPPLTSRRRPSFERRSSDGVAASPAVLPCADLSGYIERLEPPPLRARWAHFSAETMATLKERARQELLAAGDAAGAAALTRFQALSSLLWRCITRARRLSPGQETCCRAAVNNRARLRPALPAEYFGNCIDAVSTDPDSPVRAPELLERGHGWAAAAVGRAVAEHTDGAIRARVAAWAASPVVYTLRWYDPCGTMVGSSPRFDMYGCDFGWGKPAAVRSGKANKVDGRASLYPGREGGGSMDAEVTLTPEHMAALEQDEEFWAAVTPDAPAPEKKDWTFLAADQESV